MNIGTMKQSRALFFFIALMAAITSATAASVTSSMSTHPIINEYDFVVNVSTTNTAKHVVHNVTLTLLLPHEFKSSALSLGSLEPKQKNEGQFNVKINKEAKAGTYSMVLLTEYTNAAGQSFSTLSAKYITYKKAAQLKVIATLSPQIIETSDKKPLTLNVVNIDDKQHNISAKLYLPKDIKADETEKTFTVPAKGGKDIDFLIYSYGALKGSAHSAYVVVTHVDENILHTRIAGNAIDIKRGVVSDDEEIICSSGYVNADLSSDGSCETCGCESGCNGCFCDSDFDGVSDGICVGNDCVTKKTVALDCAQDNCDEKDRENNAYIGCTKNTGLACVRYPYEWPSNASFFPQDGVCAKTGRGLYECEQILVCYSEADEVYYDNCNYCKAKRGDGAACDLGLDGNFDHSYGECLNAKCQHGLCTRELVDTNLDGVFETCDCDRNNAKPCDLPPYHNRSDGFCVNGKCVRNIIVSINEETGVVRAGCENSLGLGCDSAPSIRGQEKFVQDGLCAENKNKHPICVTRGHVCRNRFSGVHHDSCERCSNKDPCDMKLSDGKFSDSQGECLKGECVRVIKPQTTSIESCPSGSRECGNETPEKSSTTTNIETSTLKKVIAETIGGENKTSFNPIYATALALIIAIAIASHLKRKKKA